MAPPPFTQSSSASQSSPATQSNPADDTSGTGFHGTRMNSDVAVEFDTGMESYNGKKNCKDSSNFVRLAFVYRIESS